MGALKITAEGLIIVGKIMKADGVEDYLKGYGEELLIKYAPTTMKWLRPESRAANSLASEIETAIADKGLRGLVQQTLNRYPQVMGDIAIGGQGIRTPNGSIYIRLVPRFLVNSEAVQEIAKPLDGAARLQQLKGGAKARELFFRELLGELDRTYRSSKVSVSKPLPAGDGRMLIHYDPDFKWFSPSNEADHIGAYYVYWNDEKTLKKERKEIQAKLDQFIIDNAALTPSEIQALTQGLKPPAHYSF